MAGLCIPVWHSWLVTYFGKEHSSHTLSLDLGLLHASSSIWSFCFPPAPPLPNWSRSPGCEAGVGSMFVVVTELLGIGAADSWAFARSTCPRSREGSMISRTSFFSVFVSGIHDRMLSFAAEKERGGEGRGGGRRGGEGEGKSGRTEDWGEIDPREKDWVRVRSAGFRA